MQNIERILVATDFSECSRSAMTVGCSLAARFPAELHLLHVIPDPAAFAVEPAGFSAAAVQQLLVDNDEAAIAALAALPADDWENGKPIVRSTVHGHVRDEIVDYADKHDIDLIVVGTHGRTGLRRVVLGSVAEGVVRLAPCAVLTVRPDEDATAPAAA